MVKQFIRKSEGLPVGVIATTVGLATLSNAYLAVGYAGVRHVTMIGAMFVWLAAFLKITVHFQTFKKEYCNVVPGSLYGTFTMLTMILGSYIFAFNATIGRGIWLAGLILHGIHIIIFTYRNVLKGIKKETFIPSWFVTYVGILVAVTVGTEKGMPTLLTAITYYGIVVYALVLPFMIYRLVKRPLPEQFRLTEAILLAPPSLCLVSYLNVSAEPQMAIVITLYALVFITLLYLFAYRLPQFLKLKFNPGFAALTFPLAIGLIASMRMSGYLLNNGMETVGEMLRQISGIQLYLTTAIIAYVAYRFMNLFLQSIKKQENLQGFDKKSVV